MLIRYIKRFFDALDVLVASLKFNLFAAALLSFVSYKPFMRNEGIDWGSFPTYAFLLGTVSFVGIGLYLLLCIVHEKMKAYNNRFDDD